MSSFKVGDVVVMTHTKGNGMKQKDVGKLAEIVERGDLFDWRISIVERKVKRSLSGHDWGVDEYQLELAYGPW